MSITTTTDATGDGLAAGDLDPRTERARAAILEAARELLEAIGPDAVTHAHVAAAAKVSRTTVYKHHPTRADLLRAAIEHVGKPWASDLTGDIRTDLRSFVAHLVDDLGDDDRALAYATFMERSLRDPVVASVREDMMCEGVEHFAEMLRLAAEAGRVRADIDADLALAEVVGTFLFRRFFAGEPVDDALADRVVDRFLAQHAPI